MLFDIENKLFSFPQGAVLVITYQNCYDDRQHLNYCTSLSIPIIAIKTGIDRTFHQEIRIFWPSVTSLQDVTGEWVEKHLNTDLRCQAIFIDGKLIKCWTTYKDWNEFLSDTSAVRKFRKEWQTEGLQWLMKQTKFSLQASTPHILLDDLGCSLRQWILWHRLVPNKELETFKLG